MSSELKNAIKKYEEIEGNFINQIESKYKLKFDKKGVFSKNHTYNLLEESPFINFKSDACVACRTGVNTTTAYLSLRCNKDCYFCFNPNQENYDKDVKRKLDTKSIANSILKNNKNIKFVALTGGEPLLYKNDTVEFFGTIKSKNDAIHKRLYTNGEFLDADILKRLRDSGVDEVRVSIKLEDDFEKQADVIENIETAKKYIKCVVVEMPVIPRTTEQMKNIMRHLDAVGIDGINLLEFCFPLHNEKEYIKRGFLLKFPPFEVFYNYWYAGGLAISGSETQALELLKFAEDERFKMGVHYCSLANKHLGQIYRQNTAYPAEKWQYFSQKDYFLKTAKVFGEDARRAKEILRKNDINEYNLNAEFNFLEFHPKHILLFTGIGIKIGLSYYVTEFKNNEIFLRELKIQEVEDVDKFNILDI